MCISRKKGSYAISVGIRSGRSALIRMKAMLFLKGDSSLVTFELESRASTSGTLEAPLSGMCALPSESQTMMRIVKNVERLVMMLRFQRCKSVVSIVHYHDVLMEYVLWRRPFRRPGSALSEEPVPESNLVPVSEAQLPCIAM